MIWRTRTSTLDLSEHGLIAGILNVTPDSFSDGGRYFHTEAAWRHGLELVEEGADILDIGGESTRPGALSVSCEEELRRVLPVVRELRHRTETLLCIDTSKAEVARLCLEEGVDIVNDVTALGDPHMASVVASFGAGLILMHMQGNPQTMQRAPYYENVACEIRDFLQRQTQRAIALGIDAMNLVLDPGIGFGKTLEHNRELLRALPTLASEGRPLLVGVSRKSFLSAFTGEEAIASRFWPAVTLTSLCREWGARIFRVHEPRPHREALQMTEAILAASLDA